MDIDRRADAEKSTTARQYEERGGGDEKSWDHNDKAYHKVRYLKDFF
jgi:hypothetical protein